MEETEIAGRLSSVEQRSKSNSHRLDALERHTEAVNTLATSVAVMAEKVEVTGEKVDGLCTDVQELIYPTHVGMNRVTFVCLDEAPIYPTHVGMNRPRV